MIKNLTERKSHVIFLLSVTEDKLLSHLVWTWSLNWYRVPHHCNAWTQCHLNDFHMFPQYSFWFSPTTPHIREPAEAVWVRGHVGGCCSKAKCVTISLVMSSLLGCDCGANSRVDPQSHITLLRHVGVRVWPLHKFTYKHLDLLEPHGVSWRVSCVTTSLSRFSILFCQRLTLQSHFSKQQS